MGFFNRKESISDTNIAMYNTLIVFMESSKGNPLRICINDPWNLGIGVERGWLNFIKWYHCRDSSVSFVFRIGKEITCINKRDITQYRIVLEGRDIK